jgi:hypothetical protein
MLVAIPVLGQLDCVGHGSGVTVCDILQLFMSPVHQAATPSAPAGPQQKTRNSRWLRLARLKITLAFSAKSRLTLPAAAEVAAGELTQQLGWYCCSTVPSEKTK